MSAWPMDLVKGRRSATKERMEIVDNRADRQAEIDIIRAKVNTTNVETGNNICIFTSFQLIIFRCRGWVGTALMLLSRSWIDY